MLLDNHRHLAGAIPIKTLWELMPDSYRSCHSLSDLASSVTYIDDNRRDFDTFLSKFDIMSLIEWDEEKIDKAVASVIKRMYKENIGCCEIHYSVNKYLSLFGTIHDAADFVGATIKEHAAARGIICDPILTINMSYDLNVSDFMKIPPNVHGVGVAGDERKQDTKKLSKILSHWHANNRKCLMHAGEVRCDHFNEIKKLKLHRIQHGVRFTDDQLKEFRDMGIWFDISLTSNLMTGIVQKLTAHPIKRMIELGCKCMISTDDPTTFNTDMGYELRTLNMLGIDHKQLSILTKENYVIT